MATPASRVAVLVSGGPDSCILAVDLCRAAEEVHPLYVRCGLPWEAKELAALERFLAAVAAPRLKRPHVLELPMRDLYGTAWYSSGRGIPGREQPDTAWEIPGRNIILLAKAAVWCRLNGTSRIALATLGTNPFPDASDRFAAAMSRALGEGLGTPLEVVLPFAARRKEELLVAARGLPLELTVSCAEPSTPGHCGRCGKCKERREAFAAAGVPDPTRYDAP